MKKKGGVGLAVLIIVILVVVVGGYFLFFGEKCSEDQLFNPYAEVCVSKSILCNLDGDCALLEGQTASFPGESLIFTLINAEELAGGKATINIGGLGEVNLIAQDDFLFGDYNILLESTDGDSERIMGAEFEVTKIEAE